MSDKDLIARLWREAAYVKPLSKGAYEALTDAADALEAATRERAAVPDAATAESERRAWAIAGHLERDREAVKAERDAALAAIERVRAIHERDMVLRDYCSECSDFGSDQFPPGQMVEWPCPTVAALDGAPEPDRKKQLERVAARLREVVYLCGDDLGCQCEEAQDASADLARELSIIAAERPTLTADEVWAIARAEHDYANDSDNVGAFVGSLTDALRTAGVAFDEQPFIDSGYLLPVEGEKP